MGIIKSREGEYDKRMMRRFFLTMICACISLVGICSLASDKSTVQGEAQISTKSDEMVLFDFDSDSSVSGWRTVNDTVMGGVSSSRMEKSADGKAIFTGNVSLKNNGGFASVRSPRMNQSLSGYEGISIRVKGDGKIYKCGLRADESLNRIFHQATFDTKIGVWQIVKIPFKEFVPTFHGRRLSEENRMRPENMRSVSFLIADKQEGHFRLEIDWIKAYR